MDGSRMDGSGMEQAKVCSAYFRKQKEFDRCFLLMREKWRSYGRTAGQVILKDSTPGERAALEGLFGYSLKEGVPRFSLTEFERAVGETRFGPIGLKELLESYFGETMESNRDKRQQDKKKKGDFLEYMGRELGTFGGWVLAMGEEKAFGYHLLMAEFDRSPVQAQALLKQAGSCLEILKKRQEKEEPPIHLALLAASATGNPHALDRGSQAGQLLAHAFSYYSACTFPCSAQELGALFFEHGVQTAEISSMVIAFGIHLETEEGLHPAYEGYISMGEPCVITLANLAKVRRAYGVWAEADKKRPVYIVENEMVFSHLLNALPGVAFSFLCTSGQPRTAAFVLLDLLALEGAQFFYAGDLDPEGMIIADRLWRRYGQCLRIWHMGSEDYHRSLSGERIDSRRLAMLDKLIHPILDDTANCLRREKAAGYQEKLVEELKKDIVG